MSDNQKAVPLDVELLDTKTIKALRKDIGDGAVKDFCCLSDEELKAEISRCTLEQSEAKRLVQKNSDYAEAKSVVSDFNTALRAKNAPLQKRVKAAAYILGTRKDAKGPTQQT